MTDIAAFNRRLGDELNKILTWAAAEVEQFERQMARLQEENMSLRGGASRASTRQLALSRQYPQPIHSDQADSPNPSDSNNSLQRNVSPRPPDIEGDCDGLRDTLRVSESQGLRVAHMCSSSSYLPTSVELCATWQDLKSYTEDFAMVQTLTDSMRSSVMSDGIVSNRSNHVPPCRISPTGKVAMSWDLVFVAVLVHDFIFIPIRMCVDVKSGDFERSISWFTRLFWTMSILVTLVTGYITSDGEIEYGFYRIGSRYLKSWALFDIVMVASDWMQVLLQGAGFLESMLLMKGLRMLRIVRVVKLVKVLKLPDILSRIKTRSYFERIELCANILTAFLCLFGVLHIIACFWFCIGDNDTGWVREYSYKERSWDAQYAVSLHWCLSQTFGNSEIYPTSNHERWFTVWVSALCFFVSTCFASEVTASLTRLSFISSQKGKQFATLRQYMQYNSISSHVCLRVFRCATFMVNKLAEDLPESDVDLLKIISDGLLAEIHYDVNVPILIKHPFFKRYNHVFPIVMQQVCHTCLSRINLSMGDVLFVAGEDAATPAMYFILHGDTTYSKVEFKPKAVMGTPWLCEMALWVPWRHRGTIRAVSYASFVMLDATKFQKMFREFKHASFYAVLYATCMLEALNAPDSWYDVDDVNYGAIDIGQLVRKVFPEQMRRTNQTTISSGTTRTSRSRSKSQVMA